MMAAAQSFDKNSSSGPASSPRTASAVALHPEVDTKVDSSIVKPNLNREYVTGVKLAVIVAVVAFASFLMLLDNMIVSTVGWASRVAQGTG